MGDGGQVYPGYPHFPEGAITGRVEQHHLDRLDEMTPELQERTDKLREQVEPKLPAVTKEHVKERLQYLAHLIQEYRQTKLGKLELGELVRDAVKSSGPMFHGTKLDQVELAIAMYEDSVAAHRANRLVAEGLDELFGAEETPS